MSITYSGDVANTKLWTVLKILFKWRGSMYRKMWKEIFLFISIYEFLTILYNYILTEQRYPAAHIKLKYIFLQCRKAYESFPVTFVLGFYVSMVVNQWFRQYKSLPWTDDIAFLISAFIQGNTQRAVLIRRTIMRYVVLAYLIAGRYLFDDFHAQFPTDQHLIKSGFINEDEFDKIYKVKSCLDRYFVPLSWSINLIYDAYREHLITVDRLLDTLIDRIATYRGQIGSLYLLDQINPPLAYSQIAGIAVYGYLLGAMIGLQRLENESNSLNFFVFTFPPFEILTIVFYIGWYKIAENLVNPYGSTEYNFDIIYSLQRNLQVAYLIVDQLHGIHPPILEEALEANFDAEGSSISIMSLNEVEEASENLSLKLPDEN